jgi:PIN domain nuclease of toxin-antitoxin system
VRLLIDTHVWIWSVIDPRRVGRRTRHALESSGSELWLSSVSVWEFINLAQKGRFQPVRDPYESLHHVLTSLSLQEAPLTHEIAAETGRFELPHRDPADRLIVATARVLGLTLVTGDQNIIDANVVPVLANE